MSNPTAPITSDHYRKVMGRLPTGVVAITGVDENGNNLGLIVGSFHVVLHRVGQVVAVDAGLVHPRGQLVRHRGR